MKEYKQKTITKEGILILKSYWANKEEEKISEESIKEYLKNNKITSFNIGNKDIYNFKIIFDKRFKIIYALRGNNLKYYVSFLNTSFALYKNKIKGLCDRHYIDYKNNILTQEVIKELLK